MVTFDYLPEFEKRAKDLARKYKSFESDYESFLNQLEKNPFGVDPSRHHISKNRISLKRQKWWGTCHNL